MVDATKFVTVNIKAGGKNKEVKFERGASFENNGGIYTVDKNGKLSVFDKNTKTKKFVNNITMTNYQYQIFENLADNKKEGKGIIFSAQDIEEAKKMYEKGKLRNDLSKDLATGYKLRKFNNIKKEDNLSFEVYNKEKSKVAATLKFGFNIKTPSTAKTEPTPNIKPTTPATVTKKEEPEKIPTNAVTGAKLFNNPNITEKPAFVYTVKKGDSFIDLAKNYEVDTYQLIAANPGLSYKVKYRKNNPSSIECKLKEGQKITIPARYSVKPGSVKNFKDVSKITGISEDYLKDLLTVTEVHPSHPGVPELTTHGDLGKDKGTPTIGFGHTGRVNGKPLSFKNKITIPEAQAYEILANDILKHEAMCMAHFGKENYRNAPQSVRAAIFDVVYNKGVWDGILNKHHNKQTKRIKKDLENRHYASALVHTRRENTPSMELRRRNCYRFITGLTDLPQTKRTAAMKDFKPYFDKVVKDSTGLDKKYLQKAWEAAEKGKTTNYRMKLAQTDR